MTALSPTSEHSSIRSPPPHSSFPSQSPVRLPPVSLPREDYLQPLGFNGGRRVSITDPFLHAYNAAPQDPSTTNGYLDSLSASNLRRGSVDEASILLSAPIKQGGHGGPNRPDAEGGSRYPVGPASGYEFGSSFSSHGSQQTTPVPSFPPPPQNSAPPSSYRFGGNQQHSTPGGSGQQESGPSYFDYSMRRHSLTNAGGGSPPRLPSIEASMQMPGISNGGNQGSGGLKRKTSSEDTIAEEGNYPYPPQYPSHLSSAPYPKRRGSGLSYDKLGSLSLSEQRRDSMMSSGGMTSGSGWEDERRGSGASYGSSNSQGYSGMTTYSMGPGGPQEHQHYDQRGHVVNSPYPPPPPHHSQQQPPNQQIPYEQSPYPQQPPPPHHHHHHQPPPPHQHSQSRPGSMSMEQASVEQEMQYNRRTSAPAQMGHDPSVMYVNGPPPPHYGPPPNSRPPPPPPPSNGSMMPPSVTHSGPDDDSSPPTSRGGGPMAPPPPHHSLPSAAGAWARAGPLPPHAHNNYSHIPRHNSLDPSSAYGPGGKQDTPYSRSPELRVSHKLAERKRRKEMAQLFDELRDALPVDRGLKSSKWEILSKAVDYIMTLQAYNTDLSNDNQMLREHFGLPPGPQAPAILGLTKPNPHLFNQNNNGGPPPGSSSHHSQSPPDGQGGPGSDYTKPSPRHTSHSPHLSAAGHVQSPRSSHGGDHGPQSMYSPAGRSPAAMSSQSHGGHSRSGSRAASDLLDRDGSETGYQNDPSLEE